MTQDVKMEQDQKILEMLERTERILEDNRHRTEHFYLFLDFDGVINVFYQPGTEKYDELMEREAFEFFDRDCVARLNRLCDDYPITVIISSSWRFAGVKSCIDYLRTAGLEDHVVIADRTQTEAFQPREMDVLQYVEEHPDCSGYIVFDDGAMPHLTSHMVQTDCFLGWDEERDQYARRLLNQQR